MSPSAGHKAGTIGVGGPAPLRHSCGDPLFVRVSWDSWMEWISEHNLREFVCGVFTNPLRIRDSQGPAVVSSFWLQTEGFKQTSWLPP